MSRVLAASLKALLSVLTFTSLMSTSSSWEVRQIKSLSCNTIRDASGTATFGATHAEKQGRCGPHLELMMMMTPQSICVFHFGSLFLERLACSAITWALVAHVRVHIQASNS